MWWYYALLFAAGVFLGTAGTLLGLVIWSVVRLHKVQDPDSIYERPNYSYRSRN